MFTYILFMSVLLLDVCAGTRQGQRPPTPRLLTAPGRFRAHEGESVTLPCAVRNLGRKSVFWLKGDSVSTRELLMQIRGLRRRPVAVRQFLQDLRSGKLATEDTNLVINNLTADDVDTYTCTVAWAGQSVTHVLEVTDSKEAPKVVMEYLPPSRSLTVAEGSSVTFACHARGSPQPTVSWYREGVEDTVLQDGPVLNLEEVMKDDAGRYVCLTRSEGAPDQQTLFTLQVQYVVVRAAAETVVVPAGERRATLTCHVEGYPVPQVSWYRNSGYVTEDTRHKFLVATNQHHLQIEQLTADDLGEYQCYVYNEAARDLASVTLSAIPGEARVLEAQPGPVPGTYNLTWAVDSVGPLRLYILEYGKEGTEHRNTSLVGPSDAPQGITYVQSGLVTLDPATTYEIMIRSVTEDNQQSSQMTQPYILTTQDTLYGAATKKTLQVLKTTLPILSRIPIIARVF